MPKDGFLVFFWILLILLEKYFQLFQDLLFPWRPETRPFELTDCLNLLMFPVDIF